MVRPGKGRNFGGMESHVFRPIMTALTVSGVGGVVVTRAKYCKSPVNRRPHGKSPFHPMPRVDADAATMAVAAMSLLMIMLLLCVCAENKCKQRQRNVVVVLFHPVPSASRPCPRRHMPRHKKQRDPHGQAYVLHVELYSSSYGSVSCPWSAGPNVNDSAMAFCSIHLGSCCRYRKE